MIKIGKSLTRSSTAMHFLLWKQHIQHDTVFLKILIIKAIGVLLLQSVDLVTYNNLFSRLTSNTDFKNLIYLSRAIMIYRILLLCKNILWHGIIIIII